jgi:hypothetical protein
LLAALVLAGCGILPPAPAEVIELAPGDVFGAPGGPAVALGRGRLPESSWEVAGYRNENGDVCTLLMIDDSPSGGGCGPVPTDGATFGPLAATPIAGDWIIVEAVLSGEVRRVRIESAGEPIEADVLSLAPIGVDATGVGLALPPGREPTAFVAIGTAGQELDRFEMLPVNPGKDEPGLAPTPETP